MKVMIKVGDRELFSDFLNLDILSPFIAGKQNLLLRFISEEFLGEVMRFQIPGHEESYIIKPGEKLTIEFKE
jgi:hypothetical protein